jgi:hypothetical protein
MLQARNRTIVDQLRVFKAGDDRDPRDPLLSPASVLLGGNICPDNQRLAEGFVTWVVAAGGGGQAIVRVIRMQAFLGLYTPALSNQVVVMAGKWHYWSDRHL